MRRERPFVFINTAVTADGKIDTVERRGAPISSPADLERVHSLRASAGAIMVGGHTLLHEDPSLTVKPEHLRAERVARGLSENPIKVGIVSHIGDPAAGPSIRSDGKFLNAGPARAVLFTTEQTRPAQIARLTERGAEVYVVGERRVDLAEALRLLKGMGVERLMVEGGGTLNAELLRLKLVDEIHLYIAPLIFGGATAPTLADGPGLPRDEAIGLRLRRCEPLDDGGIVVEYEVAE
ncbi:MAG TPA: dihydrofolate reductase family protein [Chloroflexia bacterium]|nr:dihydrofolate reductase family protein [Chloroflexia bacterium]